MELTGKCKRDFEKWYFGKSAKQFTVAYLKLAESGLNRLGVFYCSPESMQYGVYVDFFDRVGIHIGEEVNIVPTGFKFTVTFDLSKSWYPAMFRKDGRSWSITKANEIYNSKL